MTILDKLLKRSDMRDVYLSCSKNDVVTVPDAAFAFVSYHSTTLHSYVSSQSHTIFYFSIPWDVLSREDIIEEKIIDLSNGRSSISLKERSEAFQNEVLKRMIAEKKPYETLFVQKYAGDGAWDLKTVIPRVSCLEELEIMLDLENGQQ